MALERPRRSTAEEAAAASVVALFATQAAPALAQNQGSVQQAPASRSSAEAQSQPVQTRNTESQAGVASGSTVPSAPAPAANASGWGDFSYWAVIFVAIVVACWLIVWWRGRSSSSRH
jgi:cobalamin biosynthesis Mg chelatase CobN